MTNKETSDRRSVVYSFEGRWREPLERGDVEVFFRKRRPVHTPENAYFYVGVPVKQIIGGAPVKAIEPVNLRDALSMTEAGAITREELEKYIGEGGSVHAIWIGEPTIFQQPLDLDLLNERVGFNPPQSFSIVTPELNDVFAGGRI